MLDNNIKYDSFILALWKIQGQKSPQKKKLFMKDFKDLMSIFFYIFLATLAGSIPTIAIDLLRWVCKH